MSSDTGRTSFQNCVSNADKAKFYLKNGLNISVF